MKLYGIGHAETYSIIGIDPPDFSTWLVTYVTAQFPEMLCRNRNPLGSPL